MRKWQKGLALAGTAAAALALVACGKKSSDGSGSSSGSKVTVTMYRPGDVLDNDKAMMKIVNKEIQKQYPNVTLSIKPLSWGDYGQKFNVMLTSGDSFDLAFSSGSYVDNAQKGAFTDLTPLLKKYAKKAYDAINPAYWKGVTVNGKIYGFPTNANVYSQETLTFNDTFLKKYNIDVSKVNTLQDATPALAAFHKANPGVAAFAIGKGYHAPAFDATHSYEYPLSNAYPFVIDQTGESTKVVNPYSTATLQKNLKTLHQWYQAGYIPKDAATSSTAYNLPEDTWFARVETNGPFDYGATALNNARTNGKTVTVRQISKPYKSTSDAQMAMYVVSKSSKHKKEAVEVLNAINTNKKILNTMVWGIEGKQWEFTDKANEKIKTLAGYKQKTYYGAWMTGNNKLLYTKDEVTDAMIKDRDAKIAAAKQSAGLGFVPDTTSVKTEMTNISNVMSKYSDIINTGTVEPIAAIKKMNAELKGAGWDKVQAEIQKQYDEFRSNN
ncbi:ABC transporter substrate-binding protein [Lacticaseibacillus parakribbianus]|uniref:ABC transporter substrate-binding protein n=1 Tax=Lacticaseibacillus parakribbianus TaxID=2970927 RepID=UPI0021CB726E|nr:ABC transporter substrate-binding protein [Lacticaseibacillus parakribbianus]